MTTPTDAELQEAYDSVPAHGDQQVVHIAGLRAVLAKWGQPQAVAGGEPVAWRYVPSKVWGEFVYTEDPKRAQHARDNGIDVQPVFTTPQPTQPQAGAVPLTVDEVEQLIAQWSYELHGDRARYLVRMTEQHHGIKGGQHGTDT